MVLVECILLLTIGTMAGQYMKRVFLVVIACLMFAGVAKAQNYAIDWVTIDGGGGTSTGGAYSLSGTIGQPDAGNMSGGAFSLVGGFWGVTGGPVSPMLFIQGAMAGSVRVYWPRPASGFLL